MSEDFGSFEEARARGHESNDVRLRPLLWVAGITIVVGIGLYFILAFVTTSFSRHAEAPLQSALAESEPVPPQPRLQGSPPSPNLDKADMAELNRRDDQRLAAWGWTDRNARVAQVPIERAMQIALKDKRLLSGNTPATAPSRITTTRPADQNRRPG